MSHVATIDLEIKDLDSLEMACRDLGCTLVRGQTSFKWWGHWVQDYHGGDAAYKNAIDPNTFGTCEHAIKVPGAKWEIGVTKNMKGKMVLVYDFYGSEGSAIDKVCGNRLLDLKIRYGVHVSTKQARKAGFRVSESVDAETGRPKLVCSRG